MKFLLQQKWIIASAAATLIIGVYAWGLWSLATRILTDDAVRSGMQNRVDKLALDRASARVFGELRVRRQGDLARIRAFFADRSHPVAFLEVLEDLGRETGSQIAIDVDDASSDEKYFGFRMRIEGAEQGILQYLRLFERVPYAIVITGMRYERSSRDNDSSLSPGTSSKLILSFRVRAQ